MKEFVIGDIHGGYRALIQVLERASFDYENDKLIVLGDVCDGWSGTAESIEELLKIKNLVYCSGNHDDWVIKFLKEENLSKDPIEKLRQTQIRAGWFHQGGKATIFSYEKYPELIDKHLQFLKSGLLYYIDEKNRLFVHAGFDETVDIDKQDPKTYLWDRELVHLMFNETLETPDLSKYKEVYVGHTPTIGIVSHYNHLSGKPINKNNFWMMDTGATFMGKLSMMEINNKELFQSDPVFTLYPKERGRNGCLLMEEKNWNHWGLFPGENW